MQTARDALSLLEGAVAAEDWELARSSALVVAHQARLVQLSERQEQQESAEVPF